MTDLLFGRPRQWKDVGGGGGQAEGKKSKLLMVDGVVVSSQGGCVDRENTETQKRSKQGYELYEKD